MIVSHKYKFIFIKTMKTAGTSMEIALSKFCQPEDIITPISLEDERIRAELGYQGPTNCYAPITAYTLKAWAKLLLRGQKEPKIYNHTSASKAKILLGEKVWSSYYKFCFERNPWDKVISHYYWMCHSKKNPPSLHEFLNSSDMALLKKHGYEAYTENSEVIVDRVCKFENIAEEVTRLSETLGLPEVPVLPRAKSKFRKDKRPYQEVFSNEDQAFIAEYFAKEIQSLGYAY